MFTFRNFVVSLSLCVLIVGQSFACEVHVFDCGQGNTVAAKYKKQVMFFDAGRKSYSKFVAHEEATDDESTGKIGYEIKEENVDLFSLSIVTDLKKVHPKLDASATKGYVNWFKRSIERFLDGSELKAIFVSHPDIDHYNLVNSYDCLVPTKAFVLGGHYGLYGEAFRQKVESVAPRITKETADDADAYNTELEAKGVLFTDDKVKAPEVKVLGVNARGTDKIKDKNEDSMIVRIKHRHSMIIPGDAEESTWDDVAAGDNATNDPLQANILLISHHGSITNGSTTEDLLERISPKVCLISAGFEHGHPTLKTIQMLLNYYKKNHYRTNPHFVSCYNKDGLRQSIVTNAPIFTTIDNGRMSVNLSAAALIINAARDFRPSPDTHLTGSDEKDGTEYSLFFEPMPTKVLLHTELAKLKPTVFPNDEKIFVVHSKKVTGKKIPGAPKPQYYFQYGKDSKSGEPIYFAMDMIQQEITDSDDELYESDRSSDDDA